MCWNYYLNIANSVWFGISLWQCNKTSAIHFGPGHILTVMQVNVMIILMIGIGLWLQPVTMAGMVTGVFFIYVGIVIRISPLENLIPSHANCMQHILRCWERQSDSSEYKKTLRQPEPRSPLEELTALWQTPSWWKRLAAPPQEPHPRSLGHLCLDSPTPLQN